MHQKLIKILIEPVLFCYPLVGGINNLCNLILLLPDRHIDRGLVTKTHYEVCCL